MRLNRFTALVEMAGRHVFLRVGNSGRLIELLLSGIRVILNPVSGDRWVTRFDLKLVDIGFTLVSVDTRLPNTLEVEAI